MFVDYEMSGWKYMAYQPKEDLECYKIGGAKPQYCDIMEPYRIGKGGGSAHGGEWQPAKAEDNKFVGEPGSIHTTYNRQGEAYQTHIGPDGKADSEIHNSDHGNSGKHVNPHIHPITWGPNGPMYGTGIPLQEDAGIGGKSMNMEKIIPGNSFEEDRFKSISDFKWCMMRGGEVQFKWKGVMYCCFGNMGMSPEGVQKMLICQAGSAEVNHRTEKWCDNADEILDYMVGADRLRDVITQVEVWDRTI